MSIVTPSTSRVRPARFGRRAFNLTATALLAVAVVSVTSTQSHAQPSVVEVENIDGSWRLTRNGEPYYVRGAGGSSHLGMLAERGGNSIRTWGAEQLDDAGDGTGRTLMDAAHALDLTVCAGFWVQHLSGGFIVDTFRYDDPEQVERQIERARAFARKWKDHPALLVWGVGNEAIGSDVDRSFREIDRVAAAIKEIDPTHPTMTVISGIWPDLAERFARLCPNVDILGVNAYGGMQVVPKDLTKQGYDGPWMATEFGPLGHWEGKKSPWGAEIEMNSSAKADFYRTSYKKGVAADKKRCLGSYVFYWDQKQERTDTWYSMFLESGETTEAVDVMTELWGVAEAGNLAPTIGDIRADFAAKRVEAGSELKARVKARDPDGDPIAYRWVVRGESTDKRKGGEWENRPRDVDVEVVSEVEGVIVLKAPGEPGPYRLHVYASDGRGAAATANVVFYVE